MFNLIFKLHGPPLLCHGPGDQISGVPDSGGAQSQKRDRGQYHPVGPLAILVVRPPLPLEILHDIIDLRLVFAHDGDDLTVLDRQKLAHLGHGVRPRGRFPPARALLARLAGNVGGREGAQHTQHALSRAEPVGPVSLVPLDRQVSRLLVVVLGRVSRLLVVLLRPLLPHGQVFERRHAADDGLVGVYEFGEGEGHLLLRQHLSLLAVSVRPLAVVAVRLPDGRQPVFLRLSSVGVARVRQLAQHHHQLPVEHHHVVRRRVVRQGHVVVRRRNDVAGRRPSPRGVALADPPMAPFRHGPSPTLGDDPFESAADHGGTHQIQRLVLARDVGGGGGDGGRVGFGLGGEGRQRLGEDADAVKNGTEVADGGHVLHGVVVHHVLIPHEEQLHPLLLRQQTLVEKRLLLLRRFLVLLLRAVFALRAPARRRRHVAVVLVDLLEIVDLFHLSGLGILVRHGPLHLSFRRRCGTYGGIGVGRNHLFGFSRFEHGCSLKRNDYIQSRSCGPMLD
mmetsp:Transcript_32201/g.74139  ORF Transcript_32201/g.74139 Transcript_32201/m.74139 type:complete len:506 (+) Transcript_32201:1133-2650(+)